MRSLRQRLTGRDPAPSRVRYRLSRLWLTPSFRRLVRVWLPIGVCLGIISAWLATDNRLQMLNDQFSAVRHSIETRPEFMVKLMAIDGASRSLNEAVRETIPVEFPISSFDLDLESLRAQVETIDGGESADMRIRAGGLLQVRVTERMPAIVWRSADGLELLDKTGHRVAAISSRGARTDLPLIAGEGANEMASQALEIFQIAAPIRDRMLGLVRVSETRWDVILEGNIRIMLPEEGTLDALDRVVALHEAKDLLSRDLTHVDMRNRNRPTIRVSQDAVAQLRAVRAMMLSKDPEQ